MDYRIIVIGSDEDSASSEMLAEAIEQDWPEASDDLRITLLTRGDALECIGNLDDAGCVIYVPKDGVDAPLFRLLDELEERFIPTLVVAEDFNSAKAHLRGDRILICSDEEPKDRLTLRLHAMMHRQEAVQRLAQDLSTSRRFQGGLRTEISRLQEELQLAAMIQREFLPKTMPEVGDVRFGILFRPAGYVSGDMYDIRRLDETTIGFFLADAVGHGVPAALLTMIISRSLVMKEIIGQSYRIVPPTEVLERLNEDMVKHQTNGGRFATAVYGTIDIVTNKVTLAGAGHPPPLLLKPDGRYDPIETQGGLLGIFPGEKYDEVSFTINAEDRLLLFSDGFELAFPTEGDDALTRRLPTERYMEYFRQIGQAELPAQGCIDLLAQWLDSQAGSLHQVDDITAICLSTCPVPSTVTSNAA